MSYSLIYPSPLGLLGIKINNNALSQLDFLSDTKAPYSSNSTFVQHITDVLTNYFTHAKTIPALPLALQGTPFQKTVWNALSEIPYGTTVTYGELAKKLNTSPRAIGNACRRNPLPLFIPCHRVIAQKTLGGYAGATEGELMKIKQWLLQHETV